MWVFLVVSMVFSSICDMVYGGFIEVVGYFFDYGVKVYMMYGDCDYVCNWFGGEKVSFVVLYFGLNSFVNVGY